MSARPVTVQLATASYSTFRPEMGIAVAISLGKPRWSLPYDLRHEVRELMPAGLLKKPRLPAEEFDRKYVERLESFGFELIDRRLRDLAGEHGEPLVLLCWEKPGDRCHRRLFAEVWRRWTGSEVPEVGGIPKGTLAEGAQLPLDVDPRSTDA